MAATRFMHNLEIRLVEGENTAAVDLFDLNHAAGMSSPCSDGLGVLCGCPRQHLSPNIALSLSSPSPVSLATARSSRFDSALFAQMVKGKTWTPASLRAVGGAQGIGVTFLEETLAFKCRCQASPSPAVGAIRSQGAPAGKRFGHQGPDASRGELREASGYTDRPEDLTL